MPVLCFITGTSIKATFFWPNSILGPPPGCSKLGMEINACEMDRISVRLKGSCRRRIRCRRECSASNTAAGDRRFAIGEYG